MSGPDHLPAGYSLSEYRIESVLGAGGLGVTYLATDINLNLKVALKEYLPVDCSTRADDQSVRARTGPADGESFDWGLKRFLDEARTLASFRHPNIVRVMRFFEGNSTAYMVMEFVEGESLSTWIDTRRPLPQQDMLDIIVPLAGGLAVIHNAAHLHRDIKPANIYMRADGSPVLLDFGSAREIKGGDQEITAMVSPGYAPLEQYHAHGKQGPWTDLYAVGGVMYWMITGNKPVDAAARIRSDVMAPAATLLPTGRYDATVLEAIDWALRTNEDERPQSTAEFLERLGIVPIDAMSRRAMATTAAPTTRITVPPPALPSQPTTQAVQSAPPSFEPTLLKRIEAAAALHIGPIAPVIVRNATRKATSVAALCELVASEIEDEKTRAGFLKPFEDAIRTSHAQTQPRTPTAPPSTTQPPAGASTLSAELLKRIETELARQMGAIAGVVIKRAAARARDEAELYLLIADEIQDAAEKKAYVRKAVLASKTR